MPYAKYTPEEVASKGDTIYRQRLQEIVEPEYNGSFLVIDIETGAYEIDTDDVLATKRLLTSYPDAVIYGLRIGFPTAYRIGRGYSYELCETDNLPCELAKNVGTVHRRP